MINIEKTEVFGWEHAIRGMRNPKNSWLNSDSSFRNYMDDADGYIFRNYGDDITVIGDVDQELMKRLAKAGTDHRKYMRMITVYMDVTAPLYWWKEFDTYKVGTVANSCSTMHKIAEKEFTTDDFSHEHLLNELPMDERVDVEKDEPLYGIDVDGHILYYSPLGFLNMTCKTLNHFRKKYIETEDKTYWWQMIQLLPSSYNQKRTVMLNYEVLANMYKSRKGHKLDEWHHFCDFVKSLPLSELITGECEK